MCRMPAPLPPLLLPPVVGLTDMGWGLVGGGCGNPKSKSPDSHSALQSSHQNVCLPSATPLEQSRRMGTVGKGKNCRFE